MKILCFVLLPVLVQVLLALVLISLRKPGGEFVGLGVMLLGLVAIPATALINWARTRAHPPLSSLELLAKTLFTSSAFPALGLLLFIVAS